MKKDILSEIKEEFKRHTNILAEQIKNEVKTVAEGHSIITKKLEEHDNEFAQIKSELNSVKMAVMDVNRRVGSLEEKVDKNLDNHEKRLGKLEEKVLT